MGYAILRIAKIKTVGAASGMLAHALRAREVPNAIAGAPKPRVVAGAKTVAEGVALLQGGIALAKAKGGPQGFTKASTSMIDVLITVSHEDQNRLTVAQQNDYLKKGFEFAVAKFGGIENVVCAVIHRDETTFHLQLLIMPLDRQTNRFSSSKMLGGPKNFEQMQTDFHAQCGKPFGLQRGEKNSGARHIEMKKLYAAIAAGVEPPETVPVPPAPTLSDRLKPGYAEKKKVHDDAVAINQKAYKTLEKQALVGRSLHPKILEQAAAKYREAVRLGAVAAADMKTAQLAKEGAKAALKEAAAAEAVVNQAFSEHGELRQLLRVADTLASNAHGAYLAKIGYHLGISIQPGKSVLDQVRRGLGITGAGATIEALRRIDGAADELGIDPVSVAAHRQIDRDIPNG